MKKALLLFLFLPALLFSQYSIPVFERAALVTFFQQAHGEEWAMPWDLNKDPKQWYGVDIQGGHVVGLHLVGNLLSGNLSSSLSSLAELKKLDLSSNRLSGSLSGLQGLTSLQVLNLNYNDFEGDPSSGLAGMNSLHELSISHNKFEISSLSALISGLNGLTRLEVAATGLTELPTSLSSLSSLEHLDLSDNEITDFSVLGSLSQLKSLRLSNLNLTQVPSGLSSLTQLTELDLGYNKLTNFSFLNSLSQLENLSLEANNLSTVPVVIGQLSYLKSLNLSHNTIQSGWSSVAASNTLQQLLVADNQLEGEIPSEFLGISGLQYLDLSNNNLTGNLPANLPDVVELSNNRYTTEALRNYFVQDLGKTIWYINPQRYDEPAQVKAVIGGNAQLTQSLSAAPGYTFRWLKNLIEDTGVQTPTYGFSHVKAADFGLYTAEAYYQEETPAGFFELSLYREPIEFSSTLGTSEEPTDELGIYPNPTSDFIHIRIRNRKLIKTSLYDMGGRLLKTGRNEERLDLRQFPAGAYVLLVETDQGVQSFKVLKK